VCSKRKDELKLESMSFFSLASQRMEWLGARQNVIAENVANADTPGFKAREVSSFAEMLNSGATMQGMTVTSGKHIAGSAASMAGVRADTDPQAWSSSPDGNTVILEQQAIKATEVAESYRMAANLYRKGYELLTLSVTGNR
jgi:flagellar basal-body rod protein FlgB